MSSDRRVPEPRRDVATAATIATDIIGNTTAQDIKDAVAAMSSNSTGDLNATLPDESARVLSHLLHLLDQLNHVPYLEGLAREPAKGQGEIPAIRNAMRELDNGVQDNATLRVTVYASPEEGGETSLFFGVVRAGTDSSRHRCTQARSVATATRVPRDLFRGVARRRGQSPYPTGSRGTHVAMATLRAYAQRCRRESAPGIVHAYFTK